MLRRLPPFIKFGMIGVAGFIVDASVLWLALNALGLDPYTGRIISFLTALTTTWIGNRLFTFRDRNHDPLLKQWCKFFLANGAGGVINYGVYSLLVGFSSFVAAHPIWGVAMGSLMAMMFNYTASSRLVFRPLEKPKN